MPPAIRIEGLWKEYVLGGAERHGTFYDALAGALAAPWRRFRRLAGSDRERERFWALRDLTLDVAPGEVLGVIGRNGAGKSTLLKVLARITAPTRGRVRLRGRVASLLEVGTGFHPELTGRENVFLNGAILGMTRREIARRFDEIVAFAEIERFLDTPVKRYSSGMYVRLAFAVAAHLDADVLLVDEVLAVGDTEFQRRCLGSMRSASESGRTVIFVSHNLGAVAQLCSQALLLEAGEAVCLGEPAATIGRYLAGSAATASEARFEDDPAKPAQIRRVAVTDDAGRPLAAVAADRPFALEVDYEIRRWPAGSYVCVDVYDELENRLLWSCDAASREEVARPRAPGRYRARIGVPAGVLAAGRHRFTVAIYQPGTNALHDCRDRAVAVEIADPGSLLAGLGVGRHALTGIALRWETTRREPTVVG